MRARQWSILALIVGLLLALALASSQNHASPTAVQLPVAGLKVVLPEEEADHQTGRVQVLSADELISLPINHVSTSTVVTDGTLTFTGVLMRDLLSYIDYFPDTLTATALNDYEIDIPVADFIDFDVLLAWQVDNEVLTTSDKGPFWIIYPRDHHSRLQDIRYDYRWVWQLHQLTLH